MRKNKEQIAELFFKPINVFIDDMYKFEEKEMTKKKIFTKALGMID